MIRIIFYFIYAFIPTCLVTYIFNYTESGRMFLDNYIFNGIHIYGIRDIALQIHNNVVGILCTITFWVFFSIFCIIFNNEEENKKK